MSSGIVYRWDDPDADHPADPAQDILATPLGTEPGTSFAYRAAKTYLLSRIIYACSGQDLRGLSAAAAVRPFGHQEPAVAAVSPGFSLGRTQGRMAA